MKNKLSFTVALWWVILCLIAGAFLMCLSDKDSRPSESENRMLAGFPEVSAKSVLSGDFMSGFESFLSDGFFARDGVISFTNRLLGRFSLLSRDDALAAKTEEMEERLQAEGDAQAADLDGDEPAPLAEELPEEADDTEEAGELEEEGEPIPEGEIPLTSKHSYLWLKKVDGTNKLLFTYSAKKVATYAETLRILQSFLPEDGVICFTEVPLASIANRWTDQQQVYQGWGSSVGTMLESYLANDERIYIFNTFEILEPHMTEGTPLFYHTDHHWSAEGAYIVAAEMLRRQGLPVIPYEEYTYKSLQSKPNEEGQVDTFNVLYPLLPAHSYILRHVTEAKELSLMNYKTNTYLAFMNNSRKPWRRIVTGANTGRRALVICDSFGNAFTPYLLPYYDEVHMTDFRYGYWNKASAGGSISELIQYHQIDDVYIITSTANGLTRDNSIVYLRDYLLN